MKSARAKALLGPVAVGDGLAARGIDALTHRVSRVTAMRVYMRRDKRAWRHYRIWRYGDEETWVPLGLVDVLFDRVMG